MDDTKDFSMGDHSLSPMCDEMLNLTFWTNVSNVTSKGFVTYKTYVCYLSYIMLVTSKLTYFFSYQTLHIYFANLPAASYTCRTEARRSK